MKLRLRAFSCACLVAAIGCSAGGESNYGGGGGSAGSDASTQEETSPPIDSFVPFETAPPSEGGGCTDVVDVVFALDVSSSMDFVLIKLGAEIDKVVTAATALAPEPHFGLITFADNWAIDTTGPLEGGKVHTEGSTLKAAFQYNKDTYTANNRNPGDGPTGPDTQNPICEENSLDSLHAAATEFPWRATATRVVIVVTDDTFLEKPDNYGDRDGDGKWDKTDFPKEGNYPAEFTLAETVTALKDKKVRVFSFTRLKPPAMPKLYCSTGRRLPDAAMPWGWSQPYNGAPPIPDATAGKNFDIELVKSGKLSLSDTINEVVLESYCNPPIY
ncbi:MAG: VWA domain-containing protein [Deltaproteobacteria bacterium]|nr:VWA domain-containing protein [Deltaproteobacteria bacterium]